MKILSLIETREGFIFYPDTIIALLFVVLGDHEKILKMFSSRFKPLLDLIILVGPFFLHFSFPFLFLGCLF
jgi:hypothetical protein